MNKNLEKFLSLVSEECNETSRKNKERIEKRSMLRESRRIAFDVLEKLDELGWTQKDLAQKMGVSPQYVNKIVKGSENFTLETLVSLQTILNIPILASFNENSEASKAEFKGTEELAIIASLDSVEYTISSPIGNCIIQNSYQPYKIAG